jgi:hypothetical protein
MAFEGISQKSQKSPKTDTIIGIPINQLRSAIYFLEQEKLCQEENLLLNKYIDGVGVLLATKDSVITKLRQNESQYKKVVNYYKDMATNYEEITKNLDENIKIHQKFIKKQKFNRYLYALGGLAVGFFIIK